MTRAKRMQGTADSTSAARRKEGALLAIVSGIFVLGGVALRDQIPWYVPAFFAIGVVVGVLSILGVVPKYVPAPIGHLAIDEVGITRTAKGVREHVAWDDVARVRILTTDQGPHLEDVFFIVDSKKGDGCIVPQDLATRDGLLEALQSRLVGLNNGAVIEAMLSVDNRMFTIWEEGSASSQAGSTHDAKS
jgi:hypothetical protein